LPTDNRRGLRKARLDEAAKMSLSMVYLKPSRPANQFFLYLSTEHESDPINQQTKPESVEAPNEDTEREKKEKQQ